MARAGLPLLVATLALSAAAALASTVAAIAHPWELVVGEQLNAYFADRLAGGDALYADWGPGSLVFPIYPPGFYWVLAPFEWLADGALWPGRTVSALSVAFASFAAWRVARLAGCTRVEALASALAALSFTVVVILAWAGRPDGLALGLSAACVLGAVTWEDSRGRGALALAALAGAAVIVTKHNFVGLVAALAIGIWLRDRRAGLRFAGMAGAGALSAFALAELTSPGAFLDNMRDFSSTGYSLDPLRSALERILLPFPNPILAVGALAAATGLMRGPSAPMTTWAWLGAATVALTAVKVGSAANYVAALALMSGMLVGPALAWVRRSAGRVPAAGAAAALAVMLLPSGLDAVRDARVFVRDLSALGAVNAQAADRIRAVRGPALGDRHDLAVEAGQRPVFDAAPFAILAHTGHWNPAGLARAVRTREFATVQTSFDVRGPIPTVEAAPGIPDWPTSVVAAIRAAYCLGWRARASPRSPGIWLYHPCDRDGGRS